MRNNEIILKNKIANLENDAKQEKENNALTKKELIEIRSKYQTQLEEVEKLNNIIDELKMKNEILNAKNKDDNDNNNNNNLNDNQELEELKYQHNHHQLK